MNEWTPWNEWTFRRKTDLVRLIFLPNWQKWLHPKRYRLQQAHLQAYFRHLHERMTATGEDLFGAS